MDSGDNSHASSISVADEVGTLIVRMPDTLVGAEIEADRVGRDEADQTEHGVARSAVLNRPMKGGRIPTVVFAHLPEGDYELHECPHGRIRVRARVVGGRITTHDWPT